MVISSLSGFKRCHRKLGIGFYMMEVLTFDRLLVYVLILHEKIGVHLLSHFPPLSTLLKLYLNSKVTLKSICSHSIVDLGDHSPN